MRILFDHSTPSPLSRLLTGHLVMKAKQMGWDRLANGDLLTAAEQAGFEVLLTADQSIAYQQNFATRRIALVVLSTPRWAAVKLHVAAIASALQAASPGSYVEVDLSAEVE